MKRPLRPPCGYTTRNCAWRDDARTKSSAAKTSSRKASLARPRSWLQAGVQTTLRLAMATQRPAFFRDLTRCAAQTQTTSAKHRKCCVSGPLGSTDWKQLVTYSLSRLKNPATQVMRHDLSPRSSSRLERVDRAAYHAIQEVCVDHRSMIAGQR